MVPVLSRAIICVLPAISSELAVLNRIPLPGTGAWTGTLAASILDMKFRDTLIACMGGVLLAGVIMGSVSAGLFGALGAVMG